MDFESNGKDRYACLKRHVASQHQQTNVNFNTTNHQGIVNNGNNNINLIFSTPMTQEQIVAAIKTVIQEVNWDEDGSKKGNLCNIVFKVLHCNPQNPDGYVAVIPNLRKDEMLVKGQDGQTSVKSCESGAHEVLERLFESGAMELDKIVDDPAFVPLLTHHEKNDMDTCIQKTIQTLKDLPPTQRRAMSKKLSQTPSDIE